MNGLVEVTNQTILKGLKRRLEKSKKNWVEELPSVLWAYQTTPRKGIGESPICLCFGVEALIPVEIGSLSQRNMKCNTVENDRLMWEDMLFRDRVRSVAAQQDELYKRTATRYHNAQIRLSGI